MELIEFALDEYIAGRKQSLKKTMSGALDKNTRFLILCDKVKQYIDEEWTREHNSDNTEILLERQKKAILGYVLEVNYFKEKISEFLKANSLEKEDHPVWYNNLIDAIYHENWGLAGIAPWKDLHECSSCKIVGDRIFFLINGKMQLQEQRITTERLEQLRKALMLSDSSKRLDENYTEVYMTTGERVTIYTGDLVIKDQTSMVFRKYIVDALNLDEQARRGTIPKELIPALEAMVHCGVNVAFIGAVRTGKSTMLTTFQMLEDRQLEGVFIQTDPEIRIHEIMPTAPVLSLIADGEELINLSKKVVRSDADYIVVAEGRDGYAFSIIVDAANKGTYRIKTTMHLSSAEDFAYEVANKICSVMGGNLDYQIVRVAKSFNYIFEMIQLPSNRSQKRLKSIYEMRYDNNTYAITYHKICEYDIGNDTWTFAYDIGKKVREIGMLENPAALTVLDNTLKELSKKYPMLEKEVICPIYSNRVGV